MVYRLSSGSPSYLFWIAVGSFSHLVALDLTLVVVYLIHGDVVGNMALNLAVVADA
jgi:hypothetical protein